jgi:hypothetical protein
MIGESKHESDQSKRRICPTDRRVHAAADDVEVVEFMYAAVWHHERMVSLLKIASLLVEDAFRWLVILFRSAEALRAENLFFLRRHLALYIERGVRPHRVDAAMRGLSRIVALDDCRRGLPGAI